MASDAWVADDNLQAFGPAARAAVAAAEAEARGLGHDRLGTEHLLLGVLADDSSAAARALRDAGVSLAAARHKIGDSIPAAASLAVAGSAALERTARATRALKRSVRCADQRRHEVVTPECLLIGVLDIEGTAGQVLRSLGVDVDALRVALEADDGVAPVADLERIGVTPPSCPACGAPVADDLRYRTVTADGDRGPREVVAYSCGTCGAVVGVGSG